MASVGEGATVQSVDRAARILKLLARGGYLGVTEIAAELGVHKSSAHRTLGTLASHGLVEQDPRTEKYRLGFGLVGLASAVTAEIDVVSNAREASRRLSEQTGETVLLTALVGDEVVIVHQTSSSSSVLGVDWSGLHMPLHCTPGGKVLLAHMPKGEREGLVSGPLERFTANTITDPDVLHDELEVILARGYARTVEELETGLNAVAAPILRPGDEAVAAIGVYGPAFRLPAGSLDALGRTAKAAADEVSARLGYLG